MNLPTLLRGIAVDYRLLPDLLEKGTTGPEDLSGIRPPRAIHSPAPINVEVSDLIRAVERAALAWEWELTRAFWMPSPFWTRPVREAVPLSLDWSAGIIEDPPKIAADGYWQPSTVPDDVALWIEDAARETAAQLRMLINPPRAAKRVPEPCPRCEQHTLMGRVGTDAIRCVSAGCGYVHIAAVSV